MSSLGKQKKLHEWELLFLKLFASTTNYKNWRNFLVTIEHLKILNIQLYTSASRKELRKEQSFGQLQNFYFSVLEFNRVGDEVALNNVFVPMATVRGVWLSFRLMNVQIELNNFIKKFNFGRIYWSGNFGNKSMIDVDEEMRV